MSEQYPPIDWSDLSNLEFVPGSGVRKEGWEIVAVYRHERRQQMHWLVISKTKEGEYVPMDSDDFGCVTYDGRTPLIRNKPKRVTLQEVWVVYTPEGVRVTSTGYSDTAADYAKRGYIVRHIPACDVEV